MLRDTGRKCRWTSSGGRCSPRSPRRRLPVIKPHVEQADIVKVTEEEAEWLWGVPGDEALEDAEKVGTCRVALGFFLPGVEKVWG